MEPNNDKQRKAKRTTTDATPDARDASAAGVKTHDPQPGTGAAGISQELHDEAIKEAVEDIHG